jgi:hypothetical protein
VSLDEDVRTMLRRAGDRAHEVADLAERAAVQAQRRRRGWMVAAAAAAGACAFAVVIAAVLSNGGGPSGTPVAGATSVRDDLVVREGDPVEVTGVVDAEAGKPVMICSRFPHPTPSNAGRTRCSGQEPVTLTGFDVDRLDPADQSVTVRGLWNHGTIAVTSQSAPLPDESEEPVDIPCAAPLGGWKPGSDPAGMGKVERYLRQHADRFGMYWIGAPGPDPNSGATAVVVVPVVTGDLEAERAELGKLFAGNLCVIRGRVSAAEAERLFGAIQQLSSDPVNDFRGTGGLSSGDRPVRLRPVVVNEHFYLELAKLGLDKMDIKPFVKPVR